MKSKIGVVVLLVCIVLCMTFVIFGKKKDIPEPKVTIEKIRKENGRLVSENKKLESENLSLENDIELAKNCSYANINGDVNMDSLRFETEKIFYSILNCVKKGDIKSIGDFFIKDSVIQQEGKIQTYMEIVQSNLFEDDVYYIDPQFSYDGIQIFANYNIVKKNMKLGEQKKLPRLLVIYEKEETGWKVSSISKI